MSQSEAFWKLLLPCLIAVFHLTIATATTPAGDTGVSKEKGLSNGEAHKDDTGVYNEIPPSVTEPKTVKKLFIGMYDKNVQVECKAEGNPEPTMTWFRDGVKLTNNDDRIQVYSNGTLVLETFYMDDNGYFQCKATNPHGVSLSQMILIQADSTIGGVTSTEKYEVTEDEPFQLPCDNMPTTSRNLLRRWYDENNNEIRLTERVGVDLNGTLHFAYTVRDDGMKYACGLVPELSHGTNMQINLYPKGEIIVKKGDDSGQDANARPIVAYSTNSVKAFIGRKLILQCFFSAKPVASITWKNSSNHDITVGRDPRYKIEDFGRQLVIDPVRQLDEGQFVCTGTNHLGTEKSVLTVNVTTPPMTIPGGVLKSETVPDKRDIRLPCRTSAALNEHLDTPKWYRNGIPLNQRNVPSSRYTFASDYTELHITDLNKQEDTANFQCNTSNSEGYIFYDAYLRVINSIVVTKRPADVIEIEHGDVVDLSIQAQGDFCCPINKMWRINGTLITRMEDIPAFQIIPGTDQFLFNSSRVSEDSLLDLFGVYTCQVSNQYQRVSVVFSLLPKASKTLPRQDPKSSGIEIWWIGLVAGLVLILMVVIIVVIIYKSNYPGSTYKLEEQEIKHNLNPEEDLLNQSFHEI